MHIPKLASLSVMSLALLTACVPDEKPVLTTAAATTNANRVAPAATPAPSPSKATLLDFAETGPNAQESKRLYGLLEPFNVPLGRCLYAKAYDTTLSGQALRQHLEALVTTECEKYVREPLLLMTGWNAMEPVYGFSESGMRAWLGVTREAAAAAYAEILARPPTQRSARPTMATVDKEFDDAKVKFMELVEKYPNKPTKLAETINAPAPAPKPYVVTFKDLQAKNSQWDDFDKLSKIVTFIWRDCVLREAFALHAGSPDIRLVVEAAETACNGVTSRIRKFMSTWSQAERVHVRPSFDLQKRTVDAIEKNVREHATTQVLRVKAGQTVRRPATTAEDDLATLAKVEAIIQ